jgi:hypothetical protein
MIQIVLLMDDEERMVMYVKVLLKSSLYVNGSNEKNIFMKLFRFLAFGIRNEMF